MVPCFVLTAKPRSLRPISADHVIAAFFPNRRNQAAFRIARKRGCLGVLPGIIGMIQAVETIKLILGIGDSLIGRLLSFDALKMKFREFNLRRDPGMSGLRRIAHHC